MVNCVSLRFCSLTPIDIDAMTANAPIAFANVAFAECAFVECEMFIFNTSTACYSIRSVDLVSRQF